MTLVTLRCCEPRHIRFSRWGLAEDPTGEIVLVGERLYEVVSTYRREFPPAIMLKLRKFNGEPAPDVSAGYAKIVPCHFHTSTGA